MAAASRSLATARWGARFASGLLPPGYITTGDTTENRLERGQGKNNRAGNSHRPTGRREGKMQRFKSLGSTRKLLSTHAAVYNIFNVQRRLTSAQTHRAFRPATRRRARRRPWRISVCRLNPVAWLLPPDRVLLARTAEGAAFGHRALRRGASAKSYSMSA